MHLINSESLIATFLLSFIFQHEVFVKPFEQLFARLLKPSDKKRKEIKECSWAGNPEATKMVEYFQVKIIILEGKYLKFIQHLSIQHSKMGFFTCLT